jgi:ketosteroid isomerase-like protein
MKRSLALWTLAAVTAVPGFAAAVNRQAALDAVVAAEHSFAKMAAEKGTRDAFLAFLSDDSLLFAPELAPGKETWQARPASATRLTWYPTWADISLAGDLGYTTGPWELRPDPKAQEVYHGFFVTLWRKQADGSYKVEFDGGSGNDKPPASFLQGKIPKANPAKVENPPAVDAVAGQAAILNADRTFGKAAAVKGTAAYADILADESRLYRPGALPLASKKAILASPSMKAAKMTAMPLQARISSSGDLGYTLGNEQLGTDRGHYLRVWKKQTDGAWKVALDVFYPLPPPPPAAKPNPHQGSHPGGR